MAYRVGSVYQPLIQVKNKKTGTIGEPGSITMTARKPNGHEASVEPGKINPGEYEPAVQNTEAGQWELYVATTGANEGAETFVWQVKPKFG